VTQHIRTAPLARRGSLWGVYGLAALTSLLVSRANMPVTHLVFLRLAAPDADAAPVLAALRGLVGVIPGLDSFSGGANTSAEGLSRGFTHAFSMRFADAAARDAYLPHPAHERVKAFITARLAPGGESVCVVDFDDA